MTSEIVQRNKRVVWEFWQHLNDCRPDEVGDVARRYVAADASSHISHPVNDLNGVDAVIEQFWRPLRTAFPNLRRRTDLIIGGHEHWVGALGYFEGTFAQPWLGIPATGRPAGIRFGEFSAVYDDRIVLTYLILDVPDLLRQAGFELVRPGLGDEGPVPGPQTGDGVFFEEQDDAEGTRTLATARTMCGVLNRAECRSYWTEDMKWYGPSGIGTTTGYDDFEAKHQGPFNHAFPGYSGTFGVHVVDVGEGRYAGWVGWPSIRALHSGVFLGYPPTGRTVEWRLMDFYRRQGDLIAENWVPVDLLHILLGMGVDVMAELNKEVKRRAAAAQLS
ncbi:MAG TPA: ester cyclase [Anaerolineae bacterium]